MENEKSKSPGPVRGQCVEFTTNYPGHEGKTVRGYVTDAWDGIGPPHNPRVHVPGIGGIELLRRWWGESVTVVPCLFGLDTVPDCYRA